MDDYSVAVDIGGTFTDIVLRNLATNEQMVHKTPSTTEDPSRGFLTGLREVLAANSVAPSQVKHVFHGTTIATNAILENKGSPVGLVAGGIQVRIGDRPPRDAAAGQSQLMGQTSAAGAPPGHRRGAGKSGFQW